MNVNLYPKIEYKCKMKNQISTLVIAMSSAIAFEAILSSNRYQERCSIGNDNEMIT